ncbi:hypothetical protein [Herbaspirillum sp. NPDC101397]|uniref:hypothetical protein n=1 Tax=Herbaspirillum sp. NPDC101397 TaxID=3364006 RepID=UPI00383AA2FA
MRDDAADIFMSEKQVDFLTGISRGRTVGELKLTKFQLQGEFLRKKGIPFTENARGKPIVAKVAVEGRVQSDQPRKRWQPTLVGA